MSVNQNYFNKSILFDISSGFYTLWEPGFFVYSEDKTEDLYCARK